MQQISDNRHIFTSVSFEKYSLGNNGEIIDNTALTNVSSQIKSYGLANYAMLFSNDLNQIRSLFENQEKFISQAVQITKANNFAGINLDFEPGENANQQDALK